MEFTHSEVPQLFYPLLGSEYFSTLNQNICDQQSSFSWWGKHQNKLVRGVQGGWSQPCFRVYLGFQISVGDYGQGWCIS